MVEYPKTMTKKEFTDWIEKSERPLKLYVRQIREDCIMIWKLKEVWEAKR